MKRSHIILLVVMGAAVLTIVTAMGGSSEYVTFEVARQYPDKKFHVVGEWVQDKGFVYDPLTDPNRFYFHLRDSVGQVMPVVLADAKPQDFEHSEKVVLIGSMANDHFAADKILMKCPSKYDDENSIKTAGRQ